MQGHGGRGRPSIILQQPWSPELNTRTSSGVSTSAALNLVGTMPGAYVIDIGIGRDSCLINVVENGAQHMTVPDWRLAMSTTVSGGD